MEPSQTRTLWISIGAGLLAMFLLYSWSQEQKSIITRKFGSTKRVVVAKEDIQEMDTIDESKLDYLEQPVDYIQPDAVMEPEVAVGQVAAVPIKKGEQILMNKLLSPGPDTGLSMEISPGKRAIVIPVDEMRGVAHLIHPGDRIDLVAVLDYGKGQDSHREVRTILQDVVILATGSNIVNKIPRQFSQDASGKVLQTDLKITNTNFTTITIEAKPDEAQELVYILGTSPGSLFVTLRHPNDRLQAPTRITSVEDILGKPAITRVPAAAAPPVMQPPPQAVMPMKRATLPTKKTGRYQDL